jgi:hypothetical protein
LASNNDTDNGHNNDYTGEPEVFTVAKVKLFTEQSTKLLLILGCKKAGACEYGNELSGSIKCWEFLD